MAGVGKEIRIMDIDHNTLPMFRSTFGQEQHILFVAPTGLMVHPYTQPNGVHSHAAE